MEYFGLIKRITNLSLTGPWETKFAGGGGIVYPIVEDQNKNIWFKSLGYNIQAISQPDGSFSLNSAPFRRIPYYQGGTIYPDTDDNTAWFGSVDGLIHYDPGIKKNYHCEFQGT